MRTLKFKKVILPKSNTGLSTTLQFLTITRVTILPLSVADETEYQNICHQREEEEGEGEGRKDPKALFIIFILLVFVNK